MTCSRNVDHSVCSDDVADLASRFFELFIACRCYSKHITDEFIILSSFHRIYVDYYNFIMTLICSSGQNIWTL